MMGVIFLIFFILQTFTVDLIQAKNCVTPYKEKATCLPISKCDVISSALFTLTPRAVQLYKDSQCGCDGGMVCCGTSNDIPYPELINCLPVPPSIRVELSTVSDRSVCGLDATTDRIIGGDPVKAEEFPWLAALEYINKFSNKSAGIRCGGSIVTKRFILTAAHCIRSVEFEIHTVWLGLSNITSDEACSERNGAFRCIKSVRKINVARKIPHEFYSPIYNFHDIGLLELETEIEFTDYIRPICLPSKFESLSIGTFFTVAGWGLTENGKSSEIKLKVQVPVRENKICEDYLSKRNRNITTNQLCVGGERGKDSCEGDSGGPLMYDLLGENDAAQWYQEGIVSFGTGCGVRGRPAVYTRVSSYYTWIFNKITNKPGNLGKYEPCRTRTGSIGKCVPIESCPETFKLVLNKSQYFNYELGSYQCGTDGAFTTLACCEKPQTTISTDFNTTSALPDKTTCGLFKVNPGVQTDLADFPWIAGIEVLTGQGNTTEIRCIGTVINNRYVLTTIPCIFGNDYDTFQPINVWLGRWNTSCEKLNNASNCHLNPVYRIGIKKIIPYPMNNEWYYSNNALILLRNEINFSDYISPICLSSPNLPALEPGRNVTRISTKSQPITSSDALLKEELPIIECPISIKSKGGARSYDCLISKGKVGSVGLIAYGTPIMRRYEDKSSGRMQWYLVAPITWSGAKESTQFYTESIISHLDWIITIISENK